MAVTRIKAQHGTKALQNALKYVENEEKTSLAQNQKWFENGAGGLLDENTLNAFDYSANPEKTTYMGTTGETETLVSGYLCNSETATLTFERNMRKYYQFHTEHLNMQTATRVFRAKLGPDGEPVLGEDGKMIYDEDAPVWKDENGKCVYEKYQKQTQARTSYMWVMSFPPERVCGYKIDPRLCHQIAMEFCKQVAPEFPAVIATHMDREHPHCHIVMSAYAMDGSHKYRDTKDTLMAARYISDDLSQSFGLPIIMSPSRDKPVNWSEWEKKQKGESWKEQMREDIDGAMKAADGYEDFLRILESSGYKVRETEHHLTYQMPGDGEYRCRDNRLGEEYTKDRLIDLFDERRERDNPLRAAKERAWERGEEGAERIVSPAQRRAKRTRIFVSRYTMSGRRRSDLEMIFLIAVKILRAFKDLFRDKKAAEAAPNNPIHRDFVWKERQMIDSLKAVQSIGVETPDQLKEMTQVKGAELSVARSELRSLQAGEKFLKETKDLLDEAIELRREAEKIPRFSMSRLYLHERTPEDVCETVAKKYPATSKQRNQLYMLLQKGGNQYSVGRSYNQISAREAQDAIRFLQNRTDRRPPILLEGDERTEADLARKYGNIYRKRMEGEREKNSAPASPAQIARVNSILAGTDRSVDPEKLRRWQYAEMDTTQMTKFDAMQVIRYFCDSSPLLSEPSEETEQDEIRALLDSKGEKISRPLETLTRQDVKDIRDYLGIIPDRRKYARCPAILQEFEAPSDGSLKQMMELMKLRGVSPSVRFDLLSKKEVYDFTAFLLNMDAIPECLKAQKEKISGREDSLFDSAILAIDPGRGQDTVAQFRSVAQQLADIGITPDMYDSERKKMGIEAREIEERMAEVDRLNTEYRNLSRLRYNLDLAQNDRFTFGALYGKREKDDILIEEDEKKERTEEQRREDESIERKEKTDRASIINPSLFVFPDAYFDRTH